MPVVYYPKEKHFVGLCKAAYRLIFLKICMFQRLGCFMLLLNLVSSLQSVVATKGPLTLYISLAQSNSAVSNA